MLKLKDVSKFYYNKGIIASGFTKVSLELKLGEFIVITGESGSGKSTLLNVLSGMDSYEEGEMYINGLETSHYTETEFEDYRKKYIGNIFQNFNLVNSYTVYQNVELVLLINGYKKREIKNKVIDVLKQVNMLEFKNTKVSKLSGGQKQRVAIARALAKETPIIIADEPTGNLDQRSATSILSLLHKISKDKLVVIVTHNYEQVEKYATRKIKMHDGKIAEDKKSVSVNENTNLSLSTYKNMLTFSKFRIGLRNTFNIIAKFLLILLVYLFMVSGLLLEYSSFKKAEYDETKSGYNGYFQNTDDKRIVIKKEDKSAFTKDDYSLIKQNPNISYVVEDDLILDNSINLTANDLYLYGLVKKTENFTGEIDVGRMPEADNEIIISGYEQNWYIKDNKNKILENEFSILFNYTGKTSETKYKIVGINYIPSTPRVYFVEFDFYVSDNVLELIKESSEQQFSQIEVSFLGKKYQTNPWDPNMQVTPNDNVPEGTAYLSRTSNYLCPYSNCINKKIIVNNSNLYYEKEKEFNITKTYYKENYKNLIGNNKYDENNGRIYINTNDYKSLFDNSFYQSSVFVDDVDNLDTVVNQLIAQGYNTLKIKDALINPSSGYNQMIRIFKVIVTGVLVVVMFFVSYFIVKIILKSRNIYFTTLRILGAQKKICKKILDIELLTIANLAYFIFIAFIILIKNGLVNNSYLLSLLKYLNIREYLLVYFIIIGMTQLISSKFAKSLFKKSAMSTFYEEV